MMWPLDASMTLTLASQIMRRQIEIPFADIRFKNIPLNGTSTTHATASVSLRDSGKNPMKRL
jgi:hypothetical protein